MSSQACDSKKNLAERKGMDLEHECLTTNLESSKLMVRIFMAHFVI